MYAFPVQLFLTLFLSTKRRIANHQVDLETMRPTALLKFEIGCQVYCHGGRNRGRIGELKGRDRHPGMFDIVHVQDVRGEKVRRIYPRALSPVVYFYPVHLCRSES